MFTATLCLRWISIKLNVDVELFTHGGRDRSQDRAVQWHCAKPAEAHFWAETPEIIPQY